MTSEIRFSTGIHELDRALGGGLLPGTLTVVIGATGVGKTQLGLSWCHQGGSHEGKQGAMIDLSSRGDSQGHANYVKRHYGWDLAVQPMSRMDPELLFNDSAPVPQLLKFMGYEGRRVLRSQLDAEQWDAWQSQLNRHTPMLQEFLYRHLLRGTRRFLIDGIEPQDHPEDSLQLEILELMYHRMLRRPHDWLARELFRQDFRRLENRVMNHPYDDSESAAMVLVTTRESMLDQLIAKSFSEGDLSAGANTVILMGRILVGSQLQRGLYIAKHRGSYCDDSIRPFSIGEQGLQFQPTPHSNL